MNFEEFKKNTKKPVQMDLPIKGDAENIKWEIKLNDGIRDRTGEEGEIYLAYDNGKCTIDGREVPFDAFLFAIGPHRQFLESDKKFQQILKIKSNKKE